MQSRIMVLAAALSLVFAPAARATMATAPGVGGSPRQNFDGTLAGIEIGSDTNPITIFIDPFGPAWEKWIDIPIPEGLEPGTVIPVHEGVLIAPPPATSTIPLLPLTDWHEIVHTPGWEWVPHSDAAGIPPSLTVHNRLDDSGAIFAIIGGVGTHDDPMNPNAVNNAIWFGPFDPLFPTPDPLDVWIWKELVYNGPSIPPSSAGGPGLVQIHLWEYPTVPEPTSLALAGMGMGLLIWRRRRATRVC